MFKWYRFEKLDSHKSGMNIEVSFRAGRVSYYKSIINWMMNIKLDHFGKMKIARNKYRNERLSLFAFIFFALTIFAFFFSLTF